MLILDCKFDPGQWVALVHDPENKKRLVTQVATSIDNGIRYNITRDSSDMWCYEGELVLWEQTAVTVLKDGESV